MACNLRMTHKQANYADSAAVNDVDNDDAYNDNDYDVFHDNDDDD